MKPGGVSPPVLGSVCLQLALPGIFYRLMEGLQHAQMVELHIRP
jgi:hypothetical protein